MNVHWLDEPADKDYPAALSYLTLELGEHFAAQAVDALRKQGMSAFLAKDIFRASRLSLLGVSNSHVAKNLTKIREGKKLSPILLVRTKRLLVADGYHRMCAVYQHDEDAEIPCKIITV
jgi:hypothetical protein